jgi:hypothetical protein
VVVPSNTDAGSCRFELIDGTGVLELNAPCAEWAVSSSPLDPEDVVVSMGYPQAVVGRRGSDLPALPPGAVDAIGFDAAGAVLLFTFDPATAPPAAPICLAHRLVGGVWTQVAGPQPQPLLESDSRPYCLGLESAPPLVGLRRPSRDSSVDLEAFVQVPQSVKALPKARKHRWHKAPGLGFAAVTETMYDDVLLHAPVVAQRSSGRWTPLEGLAAPDNVVLQAHDGYLLACAHNRAYAYDMIDGYRQVWAREGVGCPSFWPPLGGLP